MHTVIAHANSLHSREHLFDRWKTFDLVEADGWTFEVTAQPVVGGTFEAIFHAPNGEDHLHRGEYRVVDRPSKLVFTWISAGTQQQETVVTIDFVTCDNETKMTLRHEGLPTQESADGHQQGWSEILRRLSESGTPRG